MFLFLVRHASAKKYASSGSDFDRNLSEEGVVQAKKLGEFLLSSEVSFEEVYVSTSIRTRETAKFSLASIQNIIFDDCLYLTSKRQLLQFINQLDTNKNILILGHNEGISELASYLTGQYLELNTANAVIIEFDSTNSKEISGCTGKLYKYFSPA